MKRRIDKIIDAIPMSRQEAEKQLGTDIINLAHEDNGYLVGGTKWLPAYMVDENSKPYQTDAERIAYYIKQIYEMILWFKTKPRVLTKLPTFLNAIKTLTYEINEEDGINSKSRRGSKRQHEGRVIRRVRQK